MAFRSNEVEVVKKTPPQPTLVIVKKFFLSSNGHLIQAHLDAVTFFNYEKKKASDIQRLLL